MTTPALGVDEALSAINVHLGIDAAVTHRGDEVKCWVPSEDGDGRSKCYLDAKDCEELARAFSVLASTVRVGGETGGGQRT